MCKGVFVIFYSLTRYFEKQITMKIGYARVSTGHQNIEMQIVDLKKEGCERIFQETASGARQERPQLQEMLKFAREGDTIIIWKLDRLGRSLKHLMELVAHFEEKKIGFYSVQDRIDTSTPAGKLLFQVMGALAEFERSLIIERTKAGLKAAKARGRIGGRPVGITKKLADSAEAIYNLFEQGSMGVREIAKSFKMSPNSAYKARDFWREQLEIESSKNDSTEDKP